MLKQVKTGLQNKNKMFITIQFKIFLHKNCFKNQL